MQKYLNTAVENDRDFLGLNNYDWHCFHKPEQADTRQKQTLFTRSKYEKKNRYTSVKKIHQYTEAETKWPSFSRRHFQMHFLEWIFMNFD